MEKPVETKPAGLRSSVGPAYPEQIRQGAHEHPRVDIVELPAELLVRADFPGVGAEGLDVRFDQGTLVLSGRGRPGIPEDAEILLEEFPTNDYYREFSIGDWVDPSKISAEYSRGVLTVHLPKSEVAKPRKIEIKSVR
jgi:HSP20 family molecular chaperone IbpA